MKKHTFDSDGDNPLQSEINVVPYVDVVFVLLVIFMVAVPIVQQGVTVDLPRTAKNSTAATPNLYSIPIVVEVSKEGVFKLRGYRDVESNNIKVISRVIADVYNERSEQTIFIQGDRSVPYGRIMALFVALKNTGFNKVKLMTQPSESQ